MRIYGKKISMIRGDTEGMKIVVRYEHGEKMLLGKNDKVYFTVKENKRDPNNETVIIQKIITDFLDGEAYIRIESEDTKHLDFRTYYYDIQLTRANGDVKTIIPPSEFVVGSELTYE